MRRSMKRISGAAAALAVAAALALCGPAAATASAAAAPEIRFMERLMENPPNLATV